jgi:hypothetical protein
VAKRKQKWAVGDVFAIPLSNNKYALGQIVSQEPELMKSATIALFDQSFDSIDDIDISFLCDSNKLYSVLFVTLNHIENGKWCVLGGGSTIEIETDNMPFEHTRSSGFIGAKVVGSGIVNDFVNAFFGLLPWDDWNDPQYLDSLLISADLKPVDRLIFKA